MAKRFRRWRNSGGKAGIRQRQRHPHQNKGHAARIAASSVTAPERTAFNAAAVWRRNA